MKSIQVGDRALKCEEVRVGGGKIRVWPPELASKIKDRHQQTRGYYKELWQSERRQRTGSERTEGDAYSELCSTSRWLVVR